MPGDRGGEGDRRAGDRHRLLAAVHGREGRRGRRPHGRRRCCAGAGNRDPLRLPCAATLGDREISRPPTGACERSWQARPVVHNCRGAEHAGGSKIGDTSRALPTRNARSNKDS